MLKKSVYNTKIGAIEIHCTEKHITYIKFLSDATKAKNSKSCELCDRAIIQIHEYLDYKRTQFDLPLSLEGTDFQKKVWRALCTIPYGKTVSYKTIAKAIGNPNAARAVGMANNKNPIQIVVPCHRVIGSDGSLGGYASGIKIKQQLLAIENGFN
ncbi:MAG: cysteine methyltransferase [Treponema sp. CETP13]|nr:MAG: cysteine methyltransferase [Treponema sp. CETP13]